MNSCKLRLTERLNRVCPHGFVLGILYIFLSLLENTATVSIQTLDSRSLRKFYRKAAYSTCNVQCKCDLHRLELHIEMTQKIPVNKILGLVLPKWNSWQHRFIAS